jgi:hypothetical protein
MKIKLNIFNTILFNLYKTGVSNILLPLFLMLVFTYTSLAQTTESIDMNKSSVVASPAPDLSKYRSIMFSQESIGWIGEAIKSKQQGIPLEILLPTVFPPAQGIEPALEVNKDEPLENIIKTDIVTPEKVAEEPLLEAQNFYLKSILYLSPEHWTIWLNDKKLTNNDEFLGIKIISVTSNSVFFLWNNSKIDRIFPDWKKSFYTLDDAKYASNNKNVVVNTENSDISFILSPNQSFVPTEMQILEGNVVIPVASDKDATGTANGATPGAIADTSIIPKAKPMDDSILGRHNPADGVIEMQKYMGQLNMLKSILDSTVKQ